MFKDKRKYTVREAVVESFKMHKKIYRDAKKGKPDPHGMLAETVLTWYEDGGSRAFLLELATKKIEDLTLKEVNDALHWNFKITNCKNPCRTCGQVLELDDEFWFVPFSYCEEYPCGIQLCWNCLKELITETPSPSMTDTTKMLKDIDEWAKHIEAGCKHIGEVPFVSIPTALPHCKLTDKSCRYDICPKRVKVLTDEELRELVRKGCVHDDGHLREEGAPQR